MDLTTLTAAQIDAMKQYGVRVIVGVETEPVTLEQARLQLKIVADSDGSPFDDWITQIGLPGAREWCEGYSGMSIAVKTLELATSGFPAGGIPLQFGPVNYVVGITYTDTEGLEIAMHEDDFALNQFTSPPQVESAYGLSWPSARGSTNSVRVEYVVGYDVNSDGGSTVPYNVLAAVLLTLGHLDANRENSTPVDIYEIPMGARCFLDQVRVRLGMA